MNRSLVRNDRVFARSAVQVRRRGEGTPPYGTVCRGGRLCPPGPDNATPCRAGPVCPAGCGKNLSGRRGRRPLRKRNKRCNGRAAARVAPTDGLQEGAVCRADVGIGPYESATRGAMGGRPQGSPLRKRYKGCNGRATARVAPTDGLQDVQWAGDHEGRPYGGGVVGPRSFFVFMQIYTGKTAWDLLYSSL